MRTQCLIYSVYELSPPWPCQIRVRSRITLYKSGCYINQAEHLNGTLSIQKSIGLQMNTSD